MKTKILFMINTMNLGGTEKSLISLLSVMSRDKHDVTILMLEKYGELQYFIPKWVKVEYLNGYSSIKNIISKPPHKTIIEFLKRGRLIKVLKIFNTYVKYKISKNFDCFYFEVLKKHKTIEEYDIAIAYAGPFDFISYFIVKKINAKIKVQWIHFDVSKVLSLATFGNKYYQYFDKIFCVSENAKVVFDDMFPNFCDKTSVFKNIVSKSNLEKSASIGETFSDGYDGLKILTLGRLSEEKGQQMIPSIVHRLKKDKIKFKWYLIGDGKLKDNLLSQIKELDLRNDLIVLGSKINPYRFVKDCDIYVQTSFHEGYCLTVHEAKILNKPVVITNVASADNLILNGEDGLIVEINEEAIYTGVKKLITDTKLRMLLSRNLLALEAMSEIKKFNL
ncbi:MAG: glycosyltransferase involved in cell wall biosynthesis [Flavobacteriaceae bacterium]|jgi:glycosyltransferase involved in cell wall biosynthesis